MPEWLSQSQHLNHYIIAFITGLLGGVHCFGMCGGIVGALSINNAPKKIPINILFGYNLGRILGYVCAGTLVAFIGSSLANLTGLQSIQTVLAIISACFMIALGLYLAGIWQGLAKIEIIGNRLWTYIQPISKRFMPVHTFQRALPFGFIWGWLPCGLVYTALIWTLSAGSALEGGLIMLAFGLGTLPNLLAMGIMATHLAKWVKHPKVKLIAGTIVILLGLLTLKRAFLF